MNICLVYRDALDSGGYPRDLRWLAGSLAGLGHSVTLVTTGLKKRSKAERDGLSGSVVISDGGNFDELLVTVDLVHGFCGMFIPSDLRLLRRAQGRDRCTILSPLSQLLPFAMQKRWLSKSLYLLAQRPVLKRLSAVHAFSSTEIHHVQHFSAFKGKPYFLAGLGLFPESAGPERSDRSTLKPLPFRVVFFGRNDVNQKGIDILLAGFESFLKQIPRGEWEACELVIAGKAWGESETILARFRGSHPGVPINVIGGVSEPQKFSLLREASIFVFMSRFDGPPRPIREAISVGTPVIVSPESNMGELVRSHEAGDMVALSPQALGTALRKLYSDPSVIANWRANMPRLQAALDWRAVAMDYQNGYHAALGSGC